MRQALRCRFCEEPYCATRDEADVRGVMRRVAVGNYTGAINRWNSQPADEEQQEIFEAQCIRTLEGDEPVAIREVVSFLMEKGV